MTRKELTAQLTNRENELSTQLKILDQKLYEISKTLKETRIELNKK